jgi:2,6-dihydroxypyridine 3-monooxygenase
MTNDWPRVGVIGGSLAGLTVGHLLRDIGCSVTIFERSSDELEARGAGIVVLPETSRYLEKRLGVPLESITCTTNHLRYLNRSGAIIYEAVHPHRYTGWRTIYACLLGAFEADHYRLNAEVSDFAPASDGKTVTIVLADGSRNSADLLVCADGIASRSRAKLLPAVVPDYAGYVAWRGVVPEELLSPKTRAVFADALVYQLLPASHILVYPIPAQAGATQIGRRLFNFVWYRNYAPGVPLDQLMTDRQGLVRERTLPPGALRDENRAEASDFARKHLAPPFAELVMTADEPFIQAIVDIEVPRMAFGRICLIGDAAFALRPHIAAGTAKAAADAWALAGALKATHGAVEPALEAWEPQQLMVGRKAVERARRNGNQSQFGAGWEPGDPSLSYGLSDPAVSVA